MSVKITKIENDGFSCNEVGFLMSTFVTAIKKLKLELKDQTTCFEVLELEDPNIMMIVTLKEISKQKQWEGKVFAHNNSLRILAIDS